jgi:hypothetical protein
MFYADIIVSTQSATSDQTTSTQTLYEYLKARASTLYFKCNKTTPFQDNAGYLYYIGTDAQTKDWENPSLTGKIKITASSLSPFPEYNVVHQVASSVTPGVFATHYDVDGPTWIKVDLLHNKRIIIDGYALHSSCKGCSGSYALRKWQLEGSNDDEQWTVLISHVDDTSLTNDVYCPAAWNFENNAPYRYIRLYTNSPQQNTRNNMMTIGGIEFYGRVLTR